MGCCEPNKKITIKYNVFPKKNLNEKLIDNSEDSKINSSNRTHNLKNTNDPKKIDSVITSKKATIKKEENELNIKQISDYDYSRQTKNDPSFSKMSQSSNKISINYSFNNNKIMAMKSLADYDSIKISRHICQNMQNIDIEYIILDLIGKGSYGTVFKVYHKKTGQFRAMKVINKENMDLQNDDKKFLKEIEILITLDHPSIIKIYEYFIDETNFYLIMEFVSGGELYNTITNWTESTQKKTAYIMKQILSAVSYLHSNKIIHRDLKPENMLVENKVTDENGDEEINIKIIDFGSCNFYEKNSNFNLIVGSPYYIAPEVLKKNYSEKCDIWSCGVILYVLLVGEPPFKGYNTEEILKKVLIGKYSMKGSKWENISPEAKKLVTQMLELDPSKRISADEALKTKWILDENYSTNDVNHFKKTLNNIKNRDTGEKFQQATIAYIVHSLYPSNEIKELKKVFKMLDKNGDGRLTYDELSKGFRQVFEREIHDFEIEKIIEDIDGNSDGYISYEEFMRVAINKAKLINEKNLRLAFDQFDSNKDEKLSVDEIKTVLGTTNKDYVYYLIKQINENANNVIDFNDFKRLMNSLLESKKNNMTYFSRQQ